MATKHTPPRAAKSRARAPSGAQTGNLDWSDPAAVQAFLLGLSGHLDDLDGIVEDMLLPLRERELGAVQHARIYRESVGSLRAAVAWALRARRSKRNRRGTK